MNKKQKVKMISNFIDTMNKELNETDGLNLLSCGICGDEVRFVAKGSFEELCSALFDVMQVDMQFSAMIHALVIADNELNDSDSLTNNKQSYLN